MLLPLFKGKQTVFPHKWKQGGNIKYVRWKNVAAVARRRHNTSDNVYINLITRDDDVWCRYFLAMNFLFIYFYSPRACKGDIFITLE